MVDRCSESKYQAETSFKTSGSSRPTSLLDINPEKEPLNFDINLVGAPPEIQTLVEHIKIVAERYLYRWKTFPICKNICPIFVHQSEHIIYSEHLFQQFQNL